jgi:quercetin dioxygenase-like cupin family protein
VKELGASRDFEQGSGRQSPQAAFEQRERTYEVYDADHLFPKGGQMNRRVLLRAGLLSAAGSQIPCPAWTEDMTADHMVARVSSGQDRLNEEHNIGVSHTTFKVLSAETGGNLFVIEQSNHKKGGPVRHFHYNEEEYFYVVEGNYVVEVGKERFELGPGDSLLAPRKIPHAWAFVGDKGRLLISFSPASKMEA